MQWYNDLSTHDWDKLTYLVLIAHAHAVRMETQRGGPGGVKIVAHARKHGPGRYFETHPTLADLEARVRKWGEK